MAHFSSREAHPLVILNAIDGKPLPVYGRGLNIRDWLYVDDHAKALSLVARAGKIGECYNVGGRNEKRNIDVVNLICHVLDEITPRGAGPIANSSYSWRIVPDMISATPSIARRSGENWDPPTETFETGLRKTVLWYLENPAWWEAIRSGKYRGERLGRLAQDIPLSNAKTEAHSCSSKIRR